MGNDKVVSLAAPASVSDPLTDLLRAGARRLIEAAVSGILGERSAVGCALVIDPKTDILPVLKNLSEDASEVKQIDVCRKSGRDVLNLMPGKLSVADDLAEGNVLAAARKILCRAASLTENNPAKTLAGQATTSREPYWDNEGARLAQTVLAFVLIVFEHRRTLFGTETKRAALSGTPRAVRQALGELGERAGFLERSEEIEVAAADARRELGSRAAPEVVRIDFARAVRETNFYRTCKGFAQEFERLKGDCPEPRSAREFEDATGDLVDAVALASVRCPERLSSRRGGEPGPNVLALAGHALQSLFGLKSVGEARFVAAAAAERLRPLMRRGETSDVLNSIVDYWNAMADPESTGQYTGAFGHTRTCFYAFADPVPARSLYFGCEPCFEAAGRPVWQQRLRPRLCRERRCGTWANDLCVPALPKQRRGRARRESAEGVVFRGRPEQRTAPRAQPRHAPGRLHRGRVPPVRHVRSRAWRAVFSRHLQVVPSVLCARLPVGREPAPCACRGEWDLGLDRTGDRHHPGKQRQ